VARRRTNPKELSDAVRDAVDRTVQATVGSAERTRDTVDDLVKGSRKAVADALDERRPATHEDIRELKAELRAIGRRLDAIEERLPRK
jgi:polyhydroxyalkanoate synthesis regulator phasin